MTGITINNDVTIGGEKGALLVGRYRVVRPLGQGGMGSVWLAEDVKLDGYKVAIKMLPSVLVSNRRAYAQVKQEALVSLKLSHPNIATVRAFEEEKGNPFLVMDYIDGRTLDDYLAERCVKPSSASTGLVGLPEAEVVRILKPVANALDYAHRQGVVHRDVKPGNVMIANDGTPYILDFGIAREVQETMTRVTGKLSSGTLLYMSPEQLNGAAPKPAQDVYSFAAMVYECLKGEPPFSRGQIEHQIEHNRPEALASHIAIGGAVMAGLEKSPENRPASCSGVLVAQNRPRLVRRTVVAPPRTVVSPPRTVVAPPRTVTAPPTRWDWLLPVSFGILFVVAVVWGLSCLRLTPRAGEPIEEPISSTNTPPLSSSSPPPPPPPTPPPPTPSLPMPETTDELRRVMRWIGRDRGRALQIANRLNEYEDEKEVLGIVEDFVEIGRLRKMVDVNEDRLGDLATASNVWRTIKEASERFEAYERKFSDARDGHEKQEKRKGDAITNALRRAQANVQSAEDSCKAKQWRKARELLKTAIETADKVLALSPGNEDAEELKEKAEAYLVPKLELTATVDGSPVDGVRITSGDFAWNQTLPWTSESLELGSTSKGFTVEYEKGGRRWRSSVGPIAVDWLGLKSLPCRLTEVVEPQYEYEVVPYVKDGQGAKRYLDKISKAEISGPGQVRREKHRSGGTSIVITSKTPTPNELFFLEIEAEGRCKKVSYQLTTKGRRECEVNLSE